MLYGSYTCIECVSLYIMYWKPVAFLPTMVPTLHWATGGCIQFAKGNKMLRNIELPVDLPQNT